MDTNSNNKISFKKISQLPAELKKCSFSEVLAGVCDHHILPIDRTNAEDVKLLDTIKKAMDNFMKASRKSETRYKASRANEAGSKMESAIVEEMKKTSLNPEKLGSSGYPDLHITLDGQTSYIELKTSAQKNRKGTHHRLFYFTSGKKIKMDAHHLLLQIQIAEEADKYWKVSSWELRDLYNLKVGLKTEWNANQSDFDNAGLLVKGE